VNLNAMKPWYQGMLFQSQDGAFSAGFAHSIAQLGLMCADMPGWENILKHPNV